MAEVSTESVGYRKTLNSGRECNRLPLKTVWLNTLKTSIFKNRSKLIGVDASFKLLICSSSKVCDKVWQILHL